MSYRYYSESDEALTHVQQLLDDIEPLLSARELEIFRLMRRGASTTLMAAILGIKKQNVNTYRNRIMAKAHEKTKGYDMKDGNIADFIGEALVGNFISTGLCY